ncbi:MAG: heavy-metal-associated domain-containing protein [Bacteroidaceae bacterium]|nr:heavy-metal-associated domain-containing protein [Bacteroidaceae bacterium]
MKRMMTLMVAALLVCATTMAKDLKVLVVKTAPEMHCENCEKKIKGNLRFTAGVKRIVTNRSTNTVTVYYDAEKTDSKAILSALKKVGFDGSVVADKKVDEESKKVPVDGTTGASQQKK